MARYRTYTVEFKRQVVEEHLGGVSLNQLARRHDISRELLRTWMKKYEAGEFAGDGPAGPTRLRGQDRRPQAQGRAAHHGAGPAQKGAPLGTPGERREHLRRERPEGCGVRAGCRVMSLAPSTYYYRAKAKSAEAIAAEARLVARIHAICAEFPRYGYRRVTAQLKAEGEPVNRKRVARIMREQDLRVRPKRRFVATTDSDHDGPILALPRIA